jgi:hypothetical protein
VHLYEQRKGRPMFQKTWNDKMKGENDQSHKKFKPSFFINNFQENRQCQAAQTKKNNVDSFGKRPRQQPVQC